MDDSGPLYNVRMRRGQGYNSYIQEPRIDHAVMITARSKAEALNRPSPEVVNVASTEVDTVTEAKKSALANVQNKDILTAIFEIAASGRQDGRPGSSSKESKVLPYLFNPSSNAKSNQTVFFSSKQVKSTNEIDKAMGFKASAAIKASSIGPGAEAGGSFVSSEDIHAGAVCFLVHVKVVNEAVEREEDWTFAPVDDLEGILRGPKFKEPHQKAIEFTRIYGDTFISDFVEGGEMYAFIQITSQDRKKLKELRTYASAQLTPMAAPVTVKTDVDFNRKKDALFSQAETSIRIQWRGGGEIKTHDFLWGLDSLIQIANAFPSFVSVSSAKIRAVLTPYSALKDFQRWQHEKNFDSLTLSYDHCALYVDTLLEDFNAYSELCDDLNNIIRYPEDFKSRVDKKRGQALKKGPAAITGPTSDKVQSSTAGRWPKIPQILELGRRTQEKAVENSQIPESGRLPRRGTSPAHLSTLDTTTTPGAEIATDLFQDLMNFGETPMDPDAQTMSTTRLRCRSAMVFIQEQAAALVLDPGLAHTHVHDGKPQMRKQNYPCPGVLRNLLPIPKWAGQDFGWFEKVADLDLPDEIDDAPPEYNLQPFGDPLSKYKSYETFKLGDFKIESSRFPCAVTIQPYSVPWFTKRGKAAKDRENAIAGVGLKYEKDVSSKNDATNIVKGDELFKETQFFGKWDKVETEQDWKPVQPQFNPNLINRVAVYYKPGTGLISGLELGVTGSDEHSTLEIIVSHKQRNMFGRHAELEYRSTCYPPELSQELGDRYDWMFAGLIGAFEMVGPLKKNRVLAKIAVVWKKTTAV